MRRSSRAAQVVALIALLGSVAACAVDRPDASTAPIVPGQAAPGAFTVLASENNDKSPTLLALVAAAATDASAGDGAESAEASGKGDSDAVMAPTKQGDAGTPKKTIRKKFIPHPTGDGIDPVAQTGLIGQKRDVTPTGKGKPTPPPAEPISSNGPTVGANFDSIGKGYSTFTVNSAPPDTSSAVGTTQIITAVNGGMTVQDKTGARLLGPTKISTIFSGFGGPCSTADDGDAVVRYDRLADRWVVTQFSIYSTPYYECVAVSATGDALGSWYRYAFPFTNFPDYPKLAVWPDAYYITYNMFSKTNLSWMYSTVCAMDRAAMLEGQAATQQCFNTSSSYGGLLAGDLDSATAPPEGAYNPIIALGVSNNDLAVWKMKPDFATPSNTVVLGPTKLTVSAYSMACGGGNCVKQSGTTNVLDGLGDRLMFRYAYRNFGDYQAAVVAHSVDLASTVHGTATTGIRWYEIRFAADGTASVYQQGTFTPDATYRWMPSIAMDKAGNIAMGYSTSSSTKFPSIAITGRLASDALGTMTQGETTLYAGTGSQTGTLRRWGDYASMSVDPTDDCTFWFSTEYLKASGSFNWSTRVGSFTLPGCLAPLNDGFTMAASPTSGAIAATQSAQSTISTVTTLGSGQNITLSATGLPTGATASFSPSTIATGSSTTMTINTSSNTPGGTYTVLVTGTGPATSATTSFTLTVNTFGISLSPTSASAIRDGASVATTVSVTKAGNAQSVALAATGVPTGVTATFGSTTVNSGATTTLTLAASSAAAPGTYTITVTGTGTAQSKSATLSLTVRDPVANPFLNPGFEASPSSLTSWTVSGASTGVSTTSRSGSNAARAGNTTRTSGDSKIVQIVTAPAGATRLSFWYRSFCQGTVSKDWTTATLYDASARKTTTILAKTCLKDSGWREVNVAIVAGRKYTLTLINRDDNTTTTPTYSLFDDIAIS